MRVSSGLSPLNPFRLMAQTYAQLQQQIERLQTQAKALLADEAKGVIDRIKEAIAHYGLTAEQLGFGDAKSSVTAPSSSPTPASTTAAKQTPKAASKGKGKPKFSDQSGNVWGGRGPHPGWLREALQAGHDINEYRIGKRTKPKKNLVPLGAAVAAASPVTASATASESAPASAEAPRRARVSYADDAGHTWSGMGPKPGWLKAAIESGKSLADFAK